MIIRGSHIIASRLSINVDVQILTNPSLGSSQSHAAPYQVSRYYWVSANKLIYLPTYLPTCLPACLPIYLYICFKNISRLKKVTVLKGRWVREEYNSWFLRFLCSSTSFIDPNIKTGAADLEEVKERDPPFCLFKKLFCPSIRAQVLEDVTLPAHTTLPSYVVSHGGLAGLRIRIPNRTTWSDTLPLDWADSEESKGNHVIVQVTDVIRLFLSLSLWPTRSCNLSKLYSNLSEAMWLFIICPGLTMELLFVWSRRLLHCLHPGYLKLATNVWWREMYAGVRALLLDWREVLVLPEID